MQRRSEERRFANVWLERIVWNVAAATALAVMIVVLLGSLRWLDEIAPKVDWERAVPQERAAKGADRESESRERATSVAGVRPRRG